MDKEFFDLEPVQKATLRKEKQISRVKKLNPCNTYLTLIKGFTCVAILYLPQSFLNGGWGFSIFASTFSGYLSYYCIIQLLECRAKTGGNSFTEIGEMACGTFGKTAVNLSLFFCQLGYPIAFLNFVIITFQTVF